MFQRALPGALHMAHKPKQTHTYSYVHTHTTTQAHAATCFPFPTNKNIWLARFESCHSPAHIRYLKVSDSRGAAETLISYRTNGGMRGGDVFLCVYHVSEKADMLIYTYIHSKHILYTSRETQSVDSFNLLRLNSWSMWHKYWGKNMVENTVVIKINQSLRWHLKKASYVIQKLHMISSKLHIEGLDVPMCLCIQSQMKITKTHLLRYSGGALSLRNWN